MKISDIITVAPAPQMAESMRLDENPIAPVIAFLTQLLARLGLPRFIIWLVTWLLTTSIGITVSFVLGLVGTITSEIIKLAGKGTFKGAEKIYQLIQKHLSEKEIAELESALHKELDNNLQPEEDVLKAVAGIKEPSPKEILDIVKTEEPELVTEAESVYVIVRKKDGKLLQKSSNKKELEKEFNASPGYSPKHHYIKRMIDPQQAKAEADPTHIGEADIRAFPTPEDYPIAKMDKLLRRYGVDYSMFINKPFDIKLYELLIDIYMNWEGSRIERGALFYMADQYRDRGVRAGELPPSKK